MTETVVVAVLLSFPLASLTVTSITRSTAEGLSPVLLKKTCCSAAAYWACVPAPDKVTVFPETTPVIEPGSVPSVNWSPACALVRVMVALDTVSGLGSEMLVVALAMATADPPSVKVAEVLTSCVLTRTLSILSSRLPPAVLSKRIFDVLDE